MMSLIRSILGAVILFFDRVFQPRPVSRPAEIQRKYDVEAQNLKLYQFEACPFCVKVRRHLKRRGLNIELRDVLKNAEWEKELVTQGGMRQVPCLRIEKPDGNVQWLYESSDIMSYLDQRFAT